MNPEKSERKSRRSSILKPPKPRQPFQNVELAVSSAENSPGTTTTKVKRRVSFAEKKHVKEFCDSMEQGTVWDNTYEESELSQMRHSENSNTDENTITNECKMLTKEESQISVLTKTAITLTKSISTQNKKESRPKEHDINLGDTVGGLAHTKPSGIPFPANHSGSFHARRSLSATESTFGKSPNKEKPFLPESLVSCPSQVSANTSATGSKKSVNIVPPTMQDDDCNNISMDETLIENISVGPTLPTPITLSTNAPLLRTSFDVITNIDFLKTDPISSIATHRRVSETSKDTIGPMKANDCQTISSKTQDGIIVYQDTSMEMSEAISNRVSIISNHHPKTLGVEESYEEPVLVTEQKTTFQIKTVDTVTKILGLSKKDFKELDQSAVDLRPERMPIFHNKSVLSRNAAQNISSTLTEAIQNVPSTCQLQKEPSEKTTIFHDKSVDFTGIVQNLPSIDNPQRMSQERTTLFHNKSLDFTEVVRTSESDGHRQISSQKLPSKTTDLHNHSMDITGVIPISSSIKSPEKAAPEKTMIFQNQPVDMTEVVRGHQSYETQPPEKTTIFHNQSVDITKVVCSRENDEKQPPEKTTIFHNQSVDMTEVVRTCQSYEKPPPEKTTIFHNQSVDITDVVRSHQSYEKPPPEKTTIFNDQSVDMTEVVRSRQSYEKPPPEKTTIFHDESVDMTEVVRSRQSYEKPPPQQTTVFHDQSVDMTEVVRSRQSYEKLPPQQTTVFHDQSVDMTEVVRSRQSYEKLPPEKTTIFHDQSVDMTDVVHSRQSYEKLPPEKTTIFHDQSVDMTDVVHSRQSYEKLPPEKTTIFHDQSVDTTDVVRSHQSYEKPTPEKTTVFHDQSVDMTEVVRSHQSYDKSPPEKTRVLENQSVDMTEVVRSNPAVDEPGNPDKTVTFPDKSIGATEIIPKDCILQNPIQKGSDLAVLPSSLQRTSVLDNTSTGHNDVEPVNENEPSENQHLELTEAISRVPSVSNLLSRDSCTLALERISKQKPLDLEEANRLIACIDVKTSDPEVRSPVPKRMKSLGSRQSLCDYTAAMPFVMYRKLARQRQDDSTSITCNPLSAQVHCGTASTPEDCSNISMLMTEVPAGSTNVDPSRTSPVRPVEPVEQEVQHGTTNFQNRSMEMTEAIPFHYSLKSISQVCTDSTGDADWQRQQDTTICHDDSMEITRVIPGILKVNAATYHNDSMEFTKAVSNHPSADNFSLANGNFGSVINGRFNALPASESGTMVFRDEPMELTSGIYLSSQPIERSGKNVEEFENPCSNVIAEVEKDGRTMVYRDDLMELTRAVPVPSQDRGQDKENCPPGMEYLQSRSSRKPEKKSSIGISKNEWLEMMKSVPLVSSRENEENKAGNVQSEIQRRDAGSDEITGVVPFLASQENAEKQRLDTESEDITGVVAFARDFDTEKSDVCTLKEVGSPIGFGLGEMEMTEGVRWSSGLDVEKPVNAFDNVDRQSGLPSMEIFPSPDNIQPRHSQVAKELFQQPAPINRSKSTNENPTATSETADFDAEIRKLAETFAHANSVDESGFDQATFLRQQARCMEDYEAYSTASQESHSGTMSTKNSMSIMGKTENPPDPTKSTSPRDTAAKQNLASPTVNRVISPDSKTANISILNNDNSQCNGSSRMNREDYDKSLEELRSRAYSVSKFRPEVSGFEFTGAISMMDPGNLHKSIFDEEPPSYVFSNSVSTDAIADCSALAGVSPTQRGCSPVGGKEMQDPMSLETSRVSIPEITENLKPLRNDKSEVEIISVAKETITLEEDYNNSVGVSKNEHGVERAVKSHRSQTFVTKRPSIDPTILISSSTETETELQRERLSGSTTAAEFSSESPDGPNEKIRRRESGLTTDERALSTVDKIGNETECIEIGRSWGTKTFANSTVIGEDYTRQFVRQGIEETSIVLDRPPSTELLTEIIHDDIQVVNKEPEVEKDVDATMESEDRALKSPYTVLKETIESLAERPETVWKIKHLDERIVAFTFFSRSLVVAIYLKDNAVWNSTDPIDVIGFLSQLKQDRSPPIMCLAHRMIMKKISSASLTDSYKTYEDIPQMLEYVTAEVKLGMDFMFELERLNDRMIMDIKGNSITFTVRTRDVNAGIILNITMEIKPFEEISPDDITIAYLLGQEKISENDIKRLITNVKRDHRFLRFYINDVRTYIELIAESGFSMKKKTK